MYEISTEDMKLAKEGSKEALEDIVKQNSGLVWSIVNRFISRGYSKEELYQVGCIGLIKSVKRFDMSFNVRFSTYAVPYIIGEIKRFLRDDKPIKISRKIKELSIKVKKIQEEYLKKNHEEISVNEIAKELKISKEEIASIIESSKPLESLDSETYQDINSGETKLSKISNKQEETDRLINKLTIQQLMDELDERERKIIFLRYFKDETQDDVAKIIGISQVQVSRIEKKILLFMREKLVS